MKHIARLFIVAGAIFLSIGTYQHVKSEQSGKKALQEVTELLAKSNVNTNEAKDNNGPANDETFVFMPQHGEAVGLLEIDKIDASIPIIEGTDPDELERGVGHLAETAYPGENDQVLLSGHRDTVFRKLGDLEIGDVIRVKLPHGTFEYEMVDSIIVSADDTSVIGSTAPDEELVISTCYPFGFIGNAPDRYVIYAVPIVK